MKKRILLISMFASVLFATSCSKEDEAVEFVAPAAQSTDTEVAQSEVNKTYPITLSVQKQNSISKIALGDDGKALKFESTDKLSLKDAEGHEYGVLELTNGAGTTFATFSGTIDAAAEGKEIIASIGTELLSVANSTESLADVVKKYCYLVATEKFTYNADATMPTLTLADQNAYIAFSVADGQKKVSFKKDGDANYSWYDVNTSTHNAWLAVPGGATYSTRFKSANLTAAKGNVYTVTVTDVVDLGPTFSVLWKITNEGASSATEFGTYYKWSDACSMFGTDENPIEGSYYRLPTQSELAELGSGIWVTQNSTKGQEFSNDYGFVFFPAAGFYNTWPAYIGNEGDYWSCTPINAKCYGLFFKDNTVEIMQRAVNDRSSVRLVRPL